MCLVTSERARSPCPNFLRARPPGPIAALNSSVKTSISWRALRCALVVLTLRIIEFRAQFGAAAPIFVARLGIEGLARIAQALADGEAVARRRVRHRWKHYPHRLQSRCTISTTLIRSPGRPSQMRDVRRVP